MRDLNRSSVFLLSCGVLVLAPLIGAQQAAPDAATSEFTVLSRGRAIGTTVTTVTRSTDGWSVSARETLGPPLNLEASRFEARYSPDWQPTSVAIEGSRANQPFRLSTTFADGTARTLGMQRGLEVNTTHRVSPRTIVLTTDLFPAYEALAARLQQAVSGSTFRLYVMPQGEIDAVVTRTLPHRLITPSGPLELREFDLTLANPGAPLDVEVWIDARGRLARLAVPASWLVVIRDDISSVMTREEAVTRPGDEDVFIPALGFSLAATVSGPENRRDRLPAVVLAGAPGRQDRDEVTAGIPVFGHLANALADAGFIVVRYDKRGVGRSGGRVESATVNDYAGDALNVVEWLRKRPDVDRDRVAIVGYAEGAAAALLAAARKKDVKAVCLLAAPGQTGEDVTLLLQQQELARSNEPENEKQAKIALQRRVIDAVLKGGAAWNDIPEPVRRQAETAWFKSWLLFDPAAPMKKMKQPVLIVTGSLDSQFPPDQADRLDALARQRKKLPAAATQKIIVPGVNHLLADANTTTVSPAVSSAVAQWLAAVLR